MSNRNSFSSSPTTVDVSRLSIHPILEHAPRLDKKDPRYVAMKSTWEETGVIPPILITPDNMVVDGRHRYWFAQDNDITELPALIVNPDEVPSIILGALTGRNHTNKAQKAYLAAPALAAAFEQARTRRLDMLASGGKKKLPPLTSPEELAERLGVNIQYLRQADKVHEYFNNETKWDFNNPPASAAALIFDSEEEAAAAAAESSNPKASRKKRKLTFREYFEPRILAYEDPLSLGDVLKGIGYFLGGSQMQSIGKAPARNSHLHVFTSSFQTLAKAGSRWTKLSAEDQDTAAKAVSKCLAKMPLPLLQELQQAARAHIRAKEAVASASTTGSEDPADAAASGK